MLWQLMQAIVRESTKGEFSSRYNKLLEQTPAGEAAQPQHQELTEVVKKQLPAKVMNVAINHLSLTETIQALEKQLKDKP